MTVTGLAAYRRQGDGETFPRAAETSRGGAGTIPRDGTWPFSPDPARFPPSLRPPSAGYEPGVPPVEPVHLLASREAASALTDYRLRSLRHSGFMALFYSRDRFYRFWLQDLRRSALLLTLLRESRWLRGDAPGCFSLAALAGQSQMSVARISQILGVCTATGDFTRRWDGRDARYLVFDPSPMACAALGRMVIECCDAAATLLDRHNPVPTLDAQAMLQVCRAFIDHSLACLASGNLNDRGTGSLTFLMAMADLALHSPIIMPDFVRREAARLQVTTVTLRNVLRRAERSGWIQRTGRMLVMPPEAQARARQGVLTLIHHMAAVLDVADETCLRQGQPATPQHVSQQQTHPIRTGHPAQP